MDKSHDLAGRAYAKLSALKENDIIELDSGFTCHCAGKTVVRVDRQNRLFFYCEDGRHYFDDWADDGEYLVGIYPVA